MDKEVLKSLEQLNQLRLTEAEEDTFLTFYKEQEEMLDKASIVDLSEAKPTVHVMPLLNVLREDEVHKDYTAEDLQEGAPEATNGYWQVPRLLD